MTAKTISRRGAIAAAAATIGAAALPATPSPARADEALVGEPSAFTPSFLVPPNPISEADVARTYECEVCVVGLGLAGVCALREAAESGTKVIGIEKGPDLGYRSGEFGTFGSEIHRRLGIEQPETQEAVDELMRAMGNRPNAQLLNYWIANSGPDLDWYVGTVEHELLTCDSDSPTDPEAPYILPERFPVNDNYDWRRENYPCFPGMVHILPDHGWAMHILPDHGWAMHGSLEAAEVAGASHSMAMSFGRLAGRAAANSAE